MGQNGADPVSVAEVEEPWTNGATGEMCHDQNFGSAKEVRSSRSGLSKVDQDQSGFFERRLPPRGSSNWDVDPIGCRHCADETKDQATTLTSFSFAPLPHARFRQPPRQ
jgi:hypothetical protein